MRLTRGLSGDEPNMIISGLRSGILSARTSIKFRGMEADINFNLEDSEEDLKQLLPMSFVFHGLLAQNKFDYNMSEPPLKKTVSVGNVIVILCTIGESQPKANLLGNFGLLLCL
uniref:Uncharacterized protein n=1 Tax=Tanacetum cinerariifolium TaxID=118510 RepID=A0A699KNF2_TANCI|nr:hypothetical protein [Tanacetum cinerariifolium]